MREINTMGIIMLFNGTTAPEGWLPCDGRVLKVNEYQALYSVLDGNFGVNNPYAPIEFNLPKLPNVGSCMQIICVSGEYPQRPY